MACKPSIIAALTLTLAAIAAAPAPAPASGPILDARLRQESVDDDAFAKSAYATTLRAH